MRTVVSTVVRGQVKMHVKLPCPNGHAEEIIRADDFPCDHSPSCHLPFTSLPFVFAFPSFSKFHLFFLLFVLVLENKKGPRVGASLFVKRFGFLFFTLLIDYTVQNLENADL